MDLPVCGHRTSATDSSGRNQYTCDHPQVARPHASAVVSEQFCRECGLVEFGPAAVAYQPSCPEQPTLIEYYSRAMTCMSCRSRDGNHCVLSGGSCSLAQKLARPDFACPLGNFGTIKR